jgi:thymidylate synthase
MTSLNTEEKQYLDIIENIINNGFLENTRNGFTKSIFGTSMRFSLQNNKIPIFTCKKTAWKTCLKELLWFINGSTDNKLLQKQNVHIWDGNSSREFLDSRGLTIYEEGELGPIYGAQWRNFNGKYIPLNIKNDNNTLITDNEKKIDQLQNIIDCLNNPEQRTSRRLVMSAWNPCQLEEMALPPCHILCQFNVHGGNKLSCSVYQRSQDYFLGVPFNIASYSFLTHLIAHHCGLEPYELVHFGGNAHLYDDHFDVSKELISRKPFEFPTIDILNIKNNISDYTVSDFKINNYVYHDVIKAQMRA